MDGGANGQRYKLYWLPIILARKQQPAKEQRFMVAEVSGNKFSEWTRARVKLFDRICDSRRRRRRDGPGQGSCSLYHLLWP